MAALVTQAGLSPAWKAAKIAKGGLAAFCAVESVLNWSHFKPAPARGTKPCFRIGKLTDYATVVLATLAADRSRLLNASTLSERTHIAPPTVGKLLKQLHRAGLVNSTRGTHGGYQLARDPRSISAAAILDAFEGPFALTECRAGSGHCGIEHTCRVSRTWQRLNAAIRRSLNEISLAQLAGLEPHTRHAHRARAQDHVRRPKAA